MGINSLLGVFVPHGNQEKFLFVTGLEQSQVDAPLAKRLQFLPKGSPSVHLDALRGFAAFGVLLTHWRDAFFADFPPIRQHNALVAGAYAFAELGHQWVIIFFVLSGYLVGGSVLRSVGSGKWAWREYLLRRLTRLYIVLLPALLIGGALDWSGSHLANAGAIYSGRSGMYSLTFDVHSRLTAPVFAANGLFLQGMALRGFGGKVPTFGSNGPLWSLSNEFWYYLAFPLAVLLLAKGRSLWLRIICGLGLALWAIFVSSDILLLGIPWLMGSFIGYLPAVPLRRPWTRRLVIAAVSAALGGALVLGRYSDHTGLTDMLIGVVATALVWITVHCATAPLPLVYVKLANRAARSSYTLYLTHLPFLVFLKASLQLPRAVPNWHACLVSAGLLAVTLLYSQLVYELFEKNTDGLRNWIERHAIH